MNLILLNNIPIFKLIMFKFIETQINIIKDNEVQLEDRVTAYKKANTKLKKIKGELATCPTTEIQINENNLDEIISNASQTICDMDINTMKIDDLKKLLELKSNIEGCKKFLADGKLTKVFVHDKEGTLNEITEKMKTGLFIKQIKTDALTEQIKDSPSDNK